MEIFSGIFASAKSVGRYSDAPKPNAVVQARAGVEDRHGGNLEARCFEASPASIC